MAKSPQAACSGDRAPNTEVKSSASWCRKRRSEKRIASAVVDRHLLLESRVGPPSAFRVSQLVRDGNVPSGAPFSGTKLLTLETSLHNHAPRLSFCWGGHRLLLLCICPVSLDFSGSFSARFSLGEALLLITCKGVCELDTKGRLWCALRVESLKDSTFLPFKPQACIDVTV